MSIDNFLFPALLGENVTAPRRAILADHSARHFSWNGLTLDLFLQEVFREWKPEAGAESEKKMVYPHLSVEFDRSSEFGNSLVATCYLRILPKIKPEFTNIVSFSICEEFYEASCNIHKIMNLINWHYKQLQWL